MKKLLVVAMVAGFATAANAATLSLQFGATPGGDATNANITSVGGSVTVSVLWTQTAADPGLNTVSFNTTASPEDPAGGLQSPLVEDTGLLASGNFAEGTDGLGADWGVGGAGGNIGSLVMQYAVGGNTAASSISAAGTSVVGSFQLQGLTLGAHQFYIHRSAVNPLVIAADGVETYSFAVNPAAGYAEYNIGNGFAGKNNGSGAIAMNVNVTPEPAALALLALGGIAVLRRRR